jgi:hypothetical protein
MRVLKKAKELIVKVGEGLFLQEVSIVPFKDCQRLSRWFSTEKVIRF